MPSPPILSAYDDLGELYDEWVSSVIEDVPFYLRVAGERARGREGALPVLELGAGSGRITVPLALRGHCVTGVDLSGVQLDRLGAAAERAGVAAGAIEPVFGDMRELATLLAGRTFGLAIAPFRSMLHVGDDPGPVLAQVWDLLEPGGVLAFDVFHPTPAAASEVDGEWLLRHRARAATGSWSIWERARFDEGGERLELDVRCDWRPVDPTAQLESRTTTMELHTPHPQVWRAALENAGFELVSTHAWFDGSPLEPGDDDSVWIARRPG
jgi:SAM-dependent methyltransferase